MWWIIRMERREIKIGDGRHSRSDGCRHYGAQISDISEAIIVPILWLIYTDATLPLTLYYNFIKIKIISNKTLSLPSLAFRFNAYSPLFSLHSFLSVLVRECLVNTTLASLLIFLTSFNNACILYLYNSAPHIFPYFKSLFSLKTQLPLDHIQKLSPNSHPWSLKNNKNHDAHLPKILIFHKFSCQTNIVMAYSKISLGLFKLA